MAPKPVNTVRIEGYPEAEFRAELINEAHKYLDLAGQDPERAASTCFKWALGDGVHEGHATLLFLGFPVTDELLQAVTTGEPCVTADMEFDCIGKGLRRLGTCIVFEYDCPKLGELKTKLHYKIRDQVEEPRHGFPPEEFIGHLTVARFGSGDGCESVLGSLSANVINHFAGRPFKLTGFAVVNEN